MSNWKQTAVVELRHYRRISLEGLWKTAKTLKQDSRCPVRDSIRASSSIYSVQYGAQSKLSAP
jgi:hypothetical protein